VIEERSRIAHEARRAKARRSTTEGQTVVFGEAVDDRFNAHGIDPGAVRWDAYRRHDGQWVVTASWLGGDTEQVAEWVFHLTARNVTPVDDSAADLLSDRPIRAITPVDDPVRPSLVAAPPLTAFPPMPDRHPAPLPSAAGVDEVFDQEAPDDAPRHDRAEHVTAQGVAAAGRSNGSAEHAPPLPLRLAEAIGPVPARDAPIPSMPAPTPKTARLPKVKNLGVASREGEGDRERAARPKVPSWDDILLGVRRKGD
jgi:Protein of unknown function (DUF3071)